MTDIKMYERLRHALGEEETEDLIVFIKSEVKTEFMNCKETFVTKEDKVELLQKISDVEVRLNKTIGDVRVDLTKSMSGMTLLQYLSIIISVIAIITFMTK